MQLIPRALALALVACVLVAAMPSATAQEPYPPSYTYVWDNASADLSCGWNLVHHTLEEGNQTFVAARAREAEAETNGAWETLVSTVRPISDPLAREIQRLNTEERDRIVNEAFATLELVKCLVVQGVLIPVADAAIWGNQPVACFVKSTLTCGWNVTTCNALLPLNYFVGDDPAPYPYVPPGLPATPVTRDWRECDAWWT